MKYLRQYQANSQHTWGNIISHHVSLTPLGSAGYEAGEGSAVKGVENPGWS